MGNCDFSALCGDVSVQKIAGLDGEIVADWQTSNRPDNLLFCCISGTRTYFREDNSVLLTVCPNELLLIPYGSSYRCRSDPAEPNCGIMIKFDLLDSAGNPVILGTSPQIVAQDTDGYYRETLGNILRICLQGGFSVLNAKALLFGLLSTLANEQLKAKDDPLFRSILPAVRYLQNHLQQRCSSDALAEMCFISRSTFQRRFRTYYHTSPAEWHTRLRIEKSAELLQSGLYTVEQVAELMGFCDTPYFCRTFRKITGEYAGDIRKSGLL